MSEIITNTFTKTMAIVFIIFFGSISILTSAIFLILGGVPWWATAISVTVSIAFMYAFGYINSNDSLKDKH